MTRAASRVASQRVSATPALRPIHTVLVANRGEIACRIMRTCRDMGIATVAVFSAADDNARHVREADEAIRIGEAPATASYLNIPALLQAARRAGADAIHPGYGFLAENADFAAACRVAGLNFIGPAPEVIARMGSKREAKLLMAGAGVPVVPGYAGDEQADAAFLAAARDIGYPVLVKASVGGGGKGMRIVERADDLPAALASARREALAAFGDATLLLERLIAEPRHVEFQIFGDQHGNLVHLGERECSIQRRHQKIVEETPSTALTPDLRARMAAAALTVGRTLGYTNAGTVEFILGAGGDFAFLEVNTRLQVEHPVTELVTGLDLVRWQILVAEGQPLPLTQEQITFTGHAVEARLYAEDPASEFLPASGEVALWREPQGAGVRVDAGIATGDAVSPHYDPLLAKICAHGTDRAEALRRLERALASTTLLGVRSNVDFLRRVVAHPAHRAGQISTAFIEQHAADLLAAPEPRPGDVGSVETAALVAALARTSAWGEGQRWRNNPNRPLVERYTASTASDTGERTIEVRLTPRGREAYSAVIVHAAGEEAIEVVVRERRTAALTVELDGRRVRAEVVESGGAWWVKLGGATHALVWRSPLPELQARSSGQRSLAAPMPGQVIAVLVEEGQAVRSGDPLLVLAAMKMEHTLRAPRDGVVAALRFGRGAQVPAGAVLLELRPLEEVAP